LRNPVIPGGNWVVFILGAAMPPLCVLADDLLASEHVNAAA